MRHLGVRHGELVLRVLRRFALRGVSDLHLLMVSALLVDPESLVILHIGELRDRPDLPQRLAAVLGVHMRVEVLYVDVADLPKLIDRVEEGFRRRQRL